MTVKILLVVVKIVQNHPNNCMYTVSWPGSMFAVGDVKCLRSDFLLRSSTFILAKFQVSDHSKIWIFVFLNHLRVST